MEASGRRLPTVLSPLFVGRVGAALAKSEPGQSAVKTDPRSLAAVPVGSTCTPVEGDHMDRLGAAIPHRHSE
jgi:hypothetical protein